MDAIVIYRKSAAGRRPKLNKSERERAERMFDLTVRVKRPELLDFLASDFYNLPTLPPEAVKSKPLRIVDHADDGWVVPAGSLGRAGSADASQCESVRIWIAKNCGHVVNADHVMVVLEPR